MNESVHSYGQAVVAVILAALLTSVAALLNRIDGIEQKIMHKDYLEQRLTHLQDRIEQVEQKDGR